MSRDWQLDMERCKDFTSMESKSVYIKALEYWLQQYAAEKERADKAEQEVCLLEKKIKDLKNEVNELNEVVNASIESTRLVRESLEKLMDYPKEETK